MENCKIPVSATYKYINGKIELVCAQYAEIPPEVIARLLWPVLAAEGRGTQSLVINQKKDPAL